MFDAATRAEVSTIAKTMNLEPAALLAVAQVESGGVPFGWNGRPLIRWEGHYFYRELNKLSDKAKLKDAVAQHLASVNSGGVPNPKSQQDRYALLDRARAIDTNAALASCSWGVGQVMGANWRSLVYASVAAMVDRCMQSLAGQVELMARFIRVNHLIDELQQHRWYDFALAYNGPSGPASGYDTSIETAYKAFSKG
jgi:hypothetical protein